MINCFLPSLQGHVTPVLVKVVGSAQGPDIKCLAPAVGKVALDAVQVLASLHR
jgi:hypothetical protein